MLSCGRKEIFIKSMLWAIPNYAMSCFLLLRSFCDELEGIFAKYWWQKSHGKRGISSCSWKQMCALKE